MLSDITERKQAEAELERRAAQQAAVARLGEHALEGASTVELMQEAVTCATRMLGAEISAVCELPARRGLPVAARRRRLAGSRDRKASVSRRREASQAGYTLLSGAPVVVEDWDAERRFAQPDFRRPADRLRGCRSRSRAAAARSGCSWSQSMRRRGFAPGDVDFLQSLANVLADALERQATEDAIRQRALHDPLTGLPNRVLFVDRLEHALERLRTPGALAAILFLDIDHFKLVNDSLGHQIGDELLAAVAARLKQALRGERHRGAVRRRRVRDPARGHRHRARRDRDRRADRGGRSRGRSCSSGSEHFVTTSIGIALARGGERPDELIRDADAAMYRAKERGRARYEMFDEGMRGRAIERLRVENDLRRALERDELRLDYQPVVSLENARSSGSRRCCAGITPSAG